MWAKEEKKRKENEGLKSADDETRAWYTVG